MNKATRNWRIAFQISKFYVEPQYPRDIRNRGMKIPDFGHEEVVDISYCPNCYNWTKTHFTLRITNGKFAIRCDIQGQAESAFFCSEECIKLYIQKNPDVRITEDPDGWTDEEIRHYWEDEDTYDPEK